MTIQTSKLLICFIISALTALGNSLLLQDVRTSPLPGPKQNLDRSNTSNFEAVDCKLDVELSLDKCATPLMNLVEGKVEKWPQNELDTQELCNSFIGAEKCIKEVGRKCAKGLQKQIISILGAAIHRVRKQECAKNKLPDMLKLTQCVEKNQVAVQATLTNVTTDLNLIYTQITDVNKRTTAICCMIHDIETRIRALYARICPVEGETIIRVYRGILEEVIELICRNAKCTPNFLKGYRQPRSKTNEGTISLVMRIIFSIGN